MMNTKKQMTKDIQPLLKLIQQANRTIEKAEEAGFDVKIGVGGGNLSVKGVLSLTLCSCKQDYAKAEEVKQFNVAALKQKLDLISQELKRLDEFDYYVQVTGHRPNGSDRIWAHEIGMYVRDCDFGGYEVQY